MKPLNQVTVVCVDNGQFCSVAQRLARDVKKVYYIVGRDDEVPKFNDAWIGKGFPEIELVESRDDERCDDADLWVFPDLGFAHTQTKLEAQGVPVWGARMGEELEQDVEGCKKLLKALGLPVGEWQSVLGFSKLREHLKKNPDVYVKVSKFRGSWETLYSETYELCKPELDMREVGLSFISEDIPFVVCKKLKDKVEVACDAYVVDGRWPNFLLCGMEEKGRAYLGRFMPYHEVPRPLLEVNAAFAPVLAQYNFRGFLSIETMIGADGKPYVTDPATRCPSPPGELFQEFYANYSEIIWNGANGTLIDPVAIDGATWGAEVMIKSEWVDKNWQPITFPEKWARNIKLNEACRNKRGEIGCIPQNIGFDQCGGIIGWGKSPDEAIAMIERVAADVKGIHIHIPLGAFDDLKEKMQLAESFGVGIG